MSPLIRSYLSNDTPLISSIIDKLSEKGEDIISNQNVDAGLRFYFLLIVRNITDRWVPSKKEQEQ